MPTAWEKAVHFAILIFLSYFMCCCFEQLFSVVCHECKQNNMVRYETEWGWSGGAMVLGKLPVPGRPAIWMIVGQGPTALAVGAGGDCLDTFLLFLPPFGRRPDID